jgi:hypothetical protein
VTTALRVGFGPANARKLAASAAIFAATLAITAGPALAAAPTVFRNFPTTLPGNVPSQAFQATSTSEFGDLIQLAAGERSSANLPVTVVMSSWGCESGGDDTCVTTPGATWDQALTLTLYAVDHSGATPAAVTPSILQTTQTFAIPYRPSYVPAGPCPADVVNHFYRWYSAFENACYNGLAHPVTFTLPEGITLPDELIWSIAFNTETHGYAPTGTNGPWNSLNVGAQTFSGQPSVGTNVPAAAAFLNSTWDGAYGDKGAGGLGTFRYDPTGWAANAPLACFGACPINLAAAPTPTAPPPPTPTPTLAPTAAPIESVAGATAAASTSASATPVEIVDAATATPRGATPPPTSSNRPSDGGSSGLLALLISLGFGAVGLFAVGAQRRTMRR